MDDIKEVYKQYRLVIWPIVAVAASLVVIILIIIPQILSYFNTDKDIEKVVTQVKALESKRIQLEKIDPEHNKKDLDVVLTILPEEGDVPETVVILEDLIKRSGLSSKGISFGKMPKDELADHFVLNIGVVGKISAIRAFLINLKLAPRLFIAESLNATFRKKDALVEADIPIIAYYKPLPNQIGEVGSPLPQLTSDEEKLLASLSELLEQKVAIGGASASANSDPSKVPLGKVDPFE